SDSRTLWRGSGVAGAGWTAWRSGPDAIRVYAAYRNTYKPAAIDLGLDAEPEILAPETAGSYEGGMKARFLEPKLGVDLNAFQMDFDNLVVATSENGVPGLENAGQTRFRGIEVEGDLALSRNITCRLAYSLHDARFRDYVTDFGGVPTQLEGNR